MTPTQGDPMSEPTADNPDQDRQRQLQREVGEALSAQRRYLADLAATADASRAARFPAPEGIRPDAAEAAEAGDAGDAGEAPVAAGAADEPAMTVLTDTTLPEATRVELLDRLGSSISRRAEYVAALLAIVRNQDDSTAVREAALRVLGSAAFQVARFRPHQQAYDDALHDLLTDPVSALRERAASTLAQEHDPVVQELLLDGLRGDRPLPVDRERAILLLAEDDHLDNLPWLRELYATGEPDARAEAVRFMGSYPAAQTTLEGILRDKSEASGVRQQSGAALRYLTPDRFETLAKEIATDPTDNPEVRMACLSALHQLGDTARVYADTDFVNQVQDLSSDEAAPDVAQVARQFLEQRPDE